MADPELAHARRGAPYTFDASAFLKCVASVYAAQEAERIVAPSFDHVLGDPCAEGFVIERRHKIILVEGLYVLLGTVLKCEVYRPCAAGCGGPLVALCALVSADLLVGCCAMRQSVFTVTC